MQTTSSSFSKSTRAAVAEMTYPSDYLYRIGYYDVLRLIGQECHNSMGRELVDELRASTDAQAIRHRFDRVQEMLHLFHTAIELPGLGLIDLRDTLRGLQAEGSYLAEEDLPQVCRAIESYIAWSRLLGKQEVAVDSSTPTHYQYPTLCRLAPPREGLIEIARAIESKLTPQGKLKDNASPRLAEIRSSLQSEARSIARTMRRLLSEAQSAGFVESEAQASIRSGRPVLPVTAMHKRQIPGIVHDESATGKTLYIEPLEVVEANNRIRELESEERREIVEILRRLSAPIREHRTVLEQLYLSMGRIDAVSAITRFSQVEQCHIPELRDKPILQWRQAIHPLLRHTLRQEGREVVAQDISLQYPNQRILVISGPNAGGKSVCLKTVGLLQYMLQCGIPIPVHPDSVAGVFRHIAIDIGDNQSIEDDLSTYSSHLRHMRAMAAQSGRDTLLLIDEFGGGTEPELGGAIAEGLLALFNKQGSWGIITTHYRNLKEYASTHDGIVNGAMLYDRGQMKPLFRLSIGQPGSSFALEIARQQGLPGEVLDYATERVGEEVVQSDRYVQDIVRDKQYWQRKRTEIHNKEKKLESILTDYEARLKQLKQEKREVLSQAQKEASQILDESRAQIERTIREIRESQAERERTKQARQSLLDYSRQLQSTPDETTSVEQTSKIERELQRIQRRKERKQQRSQEPTTRETAHSPVDLRQPTPPVVGDMVRITTMNQVGELVALSNNNATVIVNNKIRINCKLKELVKVSEERKAVAPDTGAKTTNVIEHLHTKRLDFSDKLDVRGMRANEALQAVQYFLDDALSLGVSRVQILHGTGTGALRVSIRELLGTFPGVSHFHDEDVRFGGAGITIVHLK